MSETRKKVIKILTILVTGIIVLTMAGIIFLPLLWHSFINFLDKKFEPPVCEVEEWEKELLIEEFPYSEETIREGKLYEHQLELLNEIRTGMSYLEEKYPGYQFSINYRDDWAVTIIDYEVTEKTTGESFKLRFDKSEGDGLQPEDDFYVYFIEDTYHEYMEEQFMQKSDKVMKVITTMTHTKGREYDNNITMDDVISGKLELHPLISVCISAEGMTEEECAQYVEKEMREAIEEINLTGTYGLDFFVMLEETEIGEVNKKCIYSDVIFWHQEGENDGR